MYWPRFRALTSDRIVEDRHMSTAAQNTEAPEKARAHRLERLRAEDPQFSDSFPLEAVAAAKRQPGLRPAQVVQKVMECYADRPALGQRARVGDRPGEWPQNPSPATPFRHHNIPRVVDALQRDCQCGAS
jgi:hypothetical protein